MSPAARSTLPSAIIIGAGIAGLATAVRLLAGGMRVTILERHAHMGGKIRTVDSAAGPVDAGPTVLTLRHVFDDLFACAGARLDDHVTLIRQDLLARHFWPDGSRLDLFADTDKSADAIATFAGPKAAKQFRRFHSRTRTLFQAFDTPMIQAPKPNLAALVPYVLARPRLIPAMAPLSTLHQSLMRQFSDPRLAQLFGRYATYVGGSPHLSPALLALIWQAEASGVWIVQGGMHKLAEAVAHLARTMGAKVCQNAHVERIETRDGRACGVHLADGTRLSADVIVHAGDPRALPTGALGRAVSGVAPQTATQPRSFSARVHSFAATVAGLDLAHHNVMFAADPLEEFKDLQAGRIPSKPSIYICAMDRGQGQDPPERERFEIITNAPATSGKTLQTETDLDTWHHQIFSTMNRFGLRFSPTPTARSITTPQNFAQMFPASLGALYGQSPHGMTASLNRPTAASGLPGLWLVGGGTHPGAGVPMATLSARHAAEAILRDLTSTSMSAPMAMPGGISTA